MVVSLMVRVMAVSSGSGSWFGFQVGLRFAGAGGLGFQELGQGGRPTGLPATELVDHDRVLRAAWWPAVGVVRDREVIGVVQLAQVLFGWPLDRNMGTVGLAAGSRFVWCPAVDGHWPASSSAAG
jgi:hypothetical protein